MVGRWVKASSSWTAETKEKSKRVGSGRKPFFPEAERRLYSWTIKQRKQGLAVSYTILRSKMMEILKEADMVELYGDLTENFKTSQRWLLAFMKRHKLTLRQCTRISQKLPSQTQGLLEKFHQFIIQLRIQNLNIFNMNEMSVWFDMAGNLLSIQKVRKQFIFVQLAMKKINSQLF